MASPIPSWFTDPAIQQLLAEPVVQRTLIFLQREKAATIPQIAQSVGHPPDKVSEALTALRQYGIVHAAATSYGQFAGVYSLTALGRDVARAITTGPNSALGGRGTSSWGT